MGLGARGRGPQAPSPISAPNRLFQAVPVFRMAYFPYLTAFRMQAKQIQRLPLRGAGAKRLKGGPWGWGQGEGARRPLPQFALALRPLNKTAPTKTG